jgi:hypothetical protein
LRFGQHALQPVGVAGALCCLAIAQVMRLLDRLGL